jgi:hypothetical protein
MEALVIIEIARFLYKIGLRDILVKYIEDDESDWDDKAISLLDKFFGEKKGSIIDLSGGLK